MKKYFLLFLISLTLFSCSKSEDEPEIPISTHITDMEESFTVARYITNINSLILYTKEISIDIPGAYNYVEMQFQGNPSMSEWTSSLMLRTLNIVRETNAYNQLWTMKTNNPSEGKVNITKTGDNYSITLKTPVMYDEVGSKVPSRTITYSGPIEVVNMLEY